MRLRQKMLVLVGVLLLSLVGTLYAVLTRIILDGFTQLEQQDTQRNVQRVTEAIQGDLKQLGLVSDDWATWDDTYRYVADRNADYAKANLLDTGLAVNLGLNFFALYNARGQPVVQRFYPQGQTVSQPLPPALERLLRQTPKLMKHGDLKGDTLGLTKLPQGLLLLASQPIITTEGKGPINGTLIMGRLVNLDQLAQRTRLELVLMAPDPAIAPGQILVRPLNAETVIGLTSLQDVQGKNIALLKIRLPRAIYRQGQTSLNYLLIAMIVVGLGFGLAVIIGLEKVVIARLTNLSTEVQAVGENQDVSLRVTAAGGDELGRLAERINDMLGDIENGAKALALERQRAEDLLLNILPEPIIDRLKEDQSTIAEHFEEVTILFADLVGFTALSSRLSPIELVSLLNRLFSRFDRLTVQLGLEKIKTIGDAYMVAAGLPEPREDHALAIADMALGMQEVVQELNDTIGIPLAMRIGINTGVVVAGVIGTKKFIYDLWGDTVNVASRMESSAEPGRIQVTFSTYALLLRDYHLEERGTVAVKGKGDMMTYWLLGRRSPEEKKQYIPTPSLPDTPRDPTPYLES